AVADGYLHARKQTAQGTADKAKQRIQTEINSLQKDLTDAQAQVDAAKPNTPQRAQAAATVDTVSRQIADLNHHRTQLEHFDPAGVGVIIRKASLPTASTSKMAIGKAVGVFGLFLMAGLAIAYAVDHRDGLGGGRRRIEQILPGATMRVLPGADRDASP